MGLILTLILILRPWVSLLPHQRIYRYHRALPWGIHSLRVQRIRKFRSPDNLLYRSLCSDSLPVIPNRLLSLHNPLQYSLYSPHPLHPLLPELIQDRLHFPRHPLPLAGLRLPDLLNGQFAKGHMPVESEERWRTLLPRILSRTSSIQPKNISRHKTNNGPLSQSKCARLPLS